MPGTTDTSPARAYRTDIQGLRAIAVSAVLLYHGGVPLITGGYVGVDIFFVISGFLITSHLVSRLERDGNVGLADFYAKRARRILPASLLVLALSVLAALLWFPPLLMRQVWQGAVATALYVPNVLFAVQGTDYLAETAPSLFQHYWSLGIEEQFYLIWPLALALAWRYSRSRRALLSVVIVAVVMSFAAGAILTYKNQPWAFFSLPTRAWELGVGAAVAIALHHKREVLRPAQAASLGWAGLALLTTSVFALKKDMAFPGFYAAIPVAGTALVILAGATATPHGPSRVLSMRVMLLLGTLSYSLYLVHWPALLIPQAAVGFENPLPLRVTLPIIAACVPLAWLLYRYVEDPIRSANRLVQARPRRTLWWSAAASVAAIAIATTASVVSDSRPLATGVEVRQANIGPSPTGTAFVPANIRPALRDASADQPAIYAAGCHVPFEAIDIEGCRFGPATAPRIVLFGDSHAAQWFPALAAYADASGYAIESHTKSACPSLMSPVLLNGSDYAECRTWRDGVIRRLNDDPPELVVLSNYARIDLTLNGRDRADAWERSLGETLDRIAALTVVVQDTPSLRATPSNCLSAHLTDALACASTRSEAVDEEVAQAVRRASELRGVHVVDMNDYICGSATCPAVIGDILVYRDEHHLTATFSNALSGALSTKLHAVVAANDEAAVPVG
ncbi:acyltransferase family protein [Cellulomonas phragmiteti]|uniref:Acyltransferase n=1 Tax=Cellulomonas phragmiteti TaxID=478780 RepID=A0ABQ4DHG9_9CELL|nr:acyltransferase family protein [Cellulomonas phragmiteti]GIG38790.1 acyltransferase [Cellulomonas phragmiteti]